MSITNDAIWAASPNTTRGQPTPLSADAKGERIAYPSNKSIFLRSIDHPELSKQYTQHTVQTTVARFAPSGFYVASGDVSGSVRVWDCAGEGATRGEYHIIAGRINDIAWDGDSQRIIAVGDGKERFGHCITADSGNSVGEISGHSSQINCVSMRQQRPFRAATGSDDTSVAFLHGAPYKFNTSLRGHHNNFIYGTAFSPDGSTLVSVGADRKVWLYDGKTGEVQRQIGEGEHRGSIFGVSWAKDSKQFATASADQTVKIWDAEAGRAVHSWKMGGDGVSVPDQQLGIVWPHGRTDGLVISVDLEGNLNYLSDKSATPIRIVQGHQRNMTAAAMTSTSSGEPSAIFTGGSDGRIRAWNVADGSASEIDGECHSNYVSGLRSSADGTGGARMYSIGWDDTMRTIDVPTKTYTGTGPGKTSGQPKSIATHPSGNIFVATPTGIDIIDPSGNKESTHQTPDSAPTAIAASPNGKNIVLASDNKSLTVFSLAGSSLTPTKTLADALTSPANSLSFSPDSTHLAAGTANGGITVFSSSDWSVATSRWSSHSARVTSIDWSADGKFAVSGSLDTNVHVWSLSKPGVRVKAGNAHKDGVNAVVWVDAGRVVSCGADAAVKIWRVDGLE